MELLRQPQKQGATMQVAMLGSFPPLRGISSYCLELASAVAEAGCTVDFISFCAMYPRALYPGGDLADDSTFPDTIHRRLTVRRTLAWYNPLGWFAEGLINNADLLHAQWWSVPLAPIYFSLCQLFRLRKKPVVLTVHNVLPHEHSPLFFQLSRLLFTSADHFVVHSLRNRDQMVRYYGISPSAISLIPHGTLDFQVNSQADRIAIRASFGFSPQHRVVLLFGAIRPYKGIETAIRAFAHTAARVPSARLLIAGKPWQAWEPYADLIRHLSIQDRVLSVPAYIPAAEVHRYFAAADLVILPYRHFDSQSGVGGSAIAFRKPLIVSRVGGLLDLVLDDRAIVPPSDVEALSAAMNECLENDRRLLKLAKDADSVAKSLSWDAIARQTIDVYRQLTMK